MDLVTGTTGTLGDKAGHCPGLSRRDGQGHPPIGVSRVPLSPGTDARASRPRIPEQEPRTMPAERQAEPVPTPASAKLAMTRAAQATLEGRPDFVKLATAALQALRSTEGTS
jgi:hypothetical protein